MPSGGRRDGAGRKKGTTKLSFAERFWIGALCARHNQIAIDFRRRLARARLSEGSEELRNIRIAYDNLQGLPQDIRAMTEHEQRDEWLDDVRGQRDEFARKQGDGFKRV